jgi:Asp/Glu/hydantoin racemase
MNQTPKFTTMSVTPQVAAALKRKVRRLGVLADRRVTTSEAVAALLLEADEDAMVELLNEAARARG